LGSTNNPHGRPRGFSESIPRVLRTSQHLLKTRVRGSIVGYRHWVLGVRQDEGLKALGDEGGRTSILIRTGVASQTRPDETKKGRKNNGFPGAGLPRYGREKYERKIKKEDTRGGSGHVYVEVANDETLRNTDQGKVLKSIRNRKRLWKFPRSEEKALSRQVLLNQKKAPTNYE